MADREIQLEPLAPVGPSLLSKGALLIHPGRHWQSKTFPAVWWNAIISGLVKKGLNPIIIGANTDDNRGTVDVDTQGCIDLRNKTSINDLMWLCKNAKVVLSNDSAPIHLAAAGDAWIGFVATCKHPDFITHWRKGQWQWREKNFGKGGLWDIIDYCPNKENEVSAEFVPPEILESWLPEPEEMVEWATEKYYAN